MAQSEIVIRVLIVTFVETIRYQIVFLAAIEPSTFPISTYISPKFSQEKIPVSLAPIRMDAIDMMTYPEPNDAFDLVRSCHVSATYRKEANIINQEMTLDSMLTTTQLGSQRSCLRAIARAQIAIPKRERTPAGMRITVTIKPAATHVEY